MSGQYVLKPFHRLISWPEPLRRHVGGAQRLHASFPQVERKAAHILTTHTFCRRTRYLCFLAIPLLSRRIVPGTGPVVCRSGQPLKMQTTSADWGGGFSSRVLAFLFHSPCNCSYSFNSLLQDSRTPWGSFSSSCFWACLITW